MSDADGYKRGAKGYAKSGVWDKSAKPLPVDFDRAKQQGPKSGKGSEDPDGDFPDHFIGGKGYKGVDKDD